MSPPRRPPFSAQRTQHHTPDGTPFCALLLSPFPPQSVVKFEKFVKDNDGKRARALKKEKDEISSRREKEAQIAALQALLEDATGRKDRLLRVLGHLSVYQQYLEAIVETSDGFGEMDDVLQRHTTLLATNADMRATLDGTHRAIEEQRVQLAAFVKEAENRRLVATSEVATQQQALEALRSENAALDGAPLLAIAIAPPSLDLVTLSRLLACRR